MSDGAGRVGSCGVRRASACVALLRWTVVGLGPSPGSSQAAAAAGRQEKCQLSLPCRLPRTFDHQSSPAAPSPCRHRGRWGRGRHRPSSLGAATRCQTRRRPSLHGRPRGACPQRCLPRLPPTLAAACHEAHGECWRHCRRLLPRHRESCCPPRHQVAAPRGHRSRRRRRHRARRPRLPPQLAAQQAAPGGLQPQQVVLLRPCWAAQSCAAR
jgi:hypothetical protein